MPHRKICFKCGGGGYVECPECRGTGRRSGSSLTLTGRMPCPRCGGRGTVKCPDCQGKGFTTPPDH